MYIGSLRTSTEKEWIVPPDANDDMCTYNDVTINRGIVRLFIEVVSNAIDHCWRSQQAGQPCKKITVDVTDRTITVTNDGQGMPVHMYNTTTVYTPEVAFGRLLTSTNYDDTEDERMTSGRNGVGVKLSNVFSSSFEVEIVYNTTKYTQKWEDHMRVCHPPRIVITKKLAKANTVRVSFTPDVALFGVECLTPDHINLFRKVCLDTAMMTTIPVVFNDHTFRVKTCIDYLKHFPFYRKSECLTLVDTPHLSAIVCGSSDSLHTNVVFTNGVYNKDGSVLADAILHELGRILSRLLNHKLKTTTITLREIKSHVCLFVRAHVNKPEFSSQSKERMIGPAPQQRITLDEAAVTTMMKWPFVARLRDHVLVKDVKTMNAIEKSKVRIDGYDPANLAGTSKASECTLIVCEGLSAKSFAVKGIEVGWNGRKGRDYFGILPLRGKPLNVRNASLTTVMKNKEVMDIAQVLNLKYGTTDSIHGLAYGKLLLLTDADSVTGDTPLCVRHHSDTPAIQICTIDDLGRNGAWTDMTNGKQYQDTIPYDVWTEKGWTRIERVIRHRTSKKRYRVSTPSGCVDVTEDHSLLTHKGDMITPQALSYGQALLHSFPYTAPHAYGAVNHDPRTCLMSHHDIFLCGLAAVHHRHRDLYVAEGELPGMSSYTIDPSSGMIHVPCRDLEAYLHIDERGRRRVPDDVVNACRACRQTYIDALTSVVDQPDTFRRKVRVKGKLLAQEVYTLLTSLGYTVTLTNTRGNMFVMYMYHTPIVNDRFTVNRIQEIQCEDDGHVYDLQTSNHHFHAGVGNMIVHNTDGIHIAALLVNMFDVLYPTLLRQPSFLYMMLTPIATVGSTVFYDEHQYRQHEHTGRSSKSVRYFKGLGTLTNQDIKAYFGQRVVRFEYDEDKAQKQLDMVFHQKYAHERKEWLAVYDPSSYVTMTDVCPVSQYAHHELIKFSFSDCQRNIPHVCDGLKMSQRKVLYAMFKRKLVATDKSMKVMQLAGYVAEVSNYHHGEQCLFDTITRMTHGFVGTQNIALLIPDGQFGTRTHGGKDSASARYIFTKLQRYTPLLFSSLDEALLTYRYDDNQKVEPEYYVPIVPLLCLNGCHTAIGTGWSSSVPCFNPKDILTCLREWIHAHDAGREYTFPDLTPWYTGFQGTIAKVDDKKYLTTGCLSHGTVKKGQRTREVYTITELPLGVWTDKYKTFLYELRDEKKIKDVKNYSTTETVHFEFTPCDPSFTVDTDSMKLTSCIYTSNMVAFDERGMLRRFDTLNDILSTYCTERYRIYVARKKHMLKEMTHTLHKTQNTRRFIECIISQEIVLHTIEEGDLPTRLKEMRFDTDNDSYAYLLGMSIQTMTKTKIRDLDRRIDDLEREIAALRKKTPGTLWQNDLDALQRIVTFDEDVKA